MTSDLPGLVAQHDCIDCKVEVADTSSRRAPRKIVTTDGEPKRCASHQREFVLRGKKQARARSIERTYGISAEEAHDLYLFQQGRCWLCQKATGATKALAVDHDHATDEVRGRLCGPCNQFIGRLGDDPEAAKRLVGYLSGDTPFRRLKATQWLANRYGVTVEQAAEKLAGLVVGDRGQYYAVTRAGIMEGPVLATSEPIVTTLAECSSCHAEHDQPHTEYCFGASIVGG